LRGLRRLGQVELQDGRRQKKQVAARLHEVEEPDRIELRIRAEFEHDDLALALDAGPVAAQAAFPIRPEDDAGAVFARAAEVAARLLDEVLPAPSFVPQSEEGATYAKKIEPADRELDLADAVDAWRRVRALSPHIGAWTVLNGRRVTVWRARLEDGAFVPEEVQPEGKRRMAYDEFLRGLR
jgi:methionyl-tRNA formyltransferase